MSFIGPEDVIGDEVSCFQKNSAERIPVLGLGAGGHAKVVIEILQLDGSYEMVGLLDPNIELRGRSVLEVPVLGDDTQLQPLYQQGIRHAFIGVGSVGDTTSRQRLYHLASTHGMQLVNAIHPSAVIAPSAIIGQGVTIMPNAVVHTCATLGANVVVNTAAVVEHDCVIGDHVHIASGACLASTVQVGEGAHIGLGAAIRQCQRIGRHAIVAAGAVVVNDVPDHAVVAGVPARIIYRTSS
jgi:sugar O-acyltransferase (sialic acid O-acetyltransferase NeuD family)